MERQEGSVVAALKGNAGFFGRVYVLVEKRTYRPAGWKKMRALDVKCRVTAKRVYTEAPLSGYVFDRATGQQIQNQESRINQNYRYTAHGSADTMKTYMNQLADIAALKPR